MERDHPSIYLLVIRNLQTWTSLSPKLQMSTHIKVQTKGDKRVLSDFYKPYVGPGLFYRRQVG